MGSVIRNFFEFVLVSSDEEQARIYHAGRVQLLQNRVALVVIGQSLVLTTVGILIKSVVQSFHTTCLGIHQIWYAYMVTFVLAYTM